MESHQQVHIKHQAITIHIFLSLLLHNIVKFTDPILKQPWNEPNQQVRIKHQARYHNANIYIMLLQK